MEDHLQPQKHWVGTLSFWVRGPYEFLYDAWIISACEGHIKKCLCQRQAHQAERSALSLSKRTAANCSVEIHALAPVMQVKDLPPPA
jgi:hypothetical protein